MEKEDDQQEFIDAGLIRRIDSTHVEITELGSRFADIVLSSVEKANDFDGKWRTAARFGICDYIGGAEYERVKQEWIDAGRPEEIPEFIAFHANNPLRK